MVWKGLLLAFALILGMACKAFGPAFHGTVLDPPLALPAFSLVDQHGKPFGLGDLKGRPALLFFGYTHCPDVCPTTLATWVRVARDLGPDAERVRFVFVTVDPERDTPERLREHLARFSPLFTGLTGEPAALEPLYKALGIYVERQEGGSASGYLVNHTASTFLVDGQGRVRAIYSFGTEPAVMADDLRLLLGR